MGQRVTYTGKLNRIGEAKRKRVLKGRQVGESRPEAGRSTHGQDED